MREALVALSSNPRRTEPGGRTIEAGQDLGRVRTASTGLSRRSVTITSHQPDQDPSIVALEAPRHSTVESEAPILCLVRRGPPGQRGASLTPPLRPFPSTNRAAQVGGKVIRPAFVPRSPPHMLASVRSNHSPRPGTIVDRVRRRSEGPRKRQPRVNPITIAQGDSAYK